MIPETDPFPPDEFDRWAGEYDADVTSDSFPFTGYERVLGEVVRLSEPRPGLSVLDLGTGTGNLAERLLQQGCELWCTDFSEEMLKLASAKLPAARFFQHDLRQPFPPALARRFDRIVSAYVFHHFELPEKAALVRRLVDEHLNPGGRLVVADISFPTRADLDAMRNQAGDEWSEEPYWVAEEALPVMEGVQYKQVSSCAGVYWAEKISL